MPSASPYFDTDCNITALSQAIEIPISPTPLLFILNPDDIVYNDEDAGATLSIKYNRFTRDLKAVFKTFDITLYSLAAEEVKQIEAFANTEFLNTVRTTGLGSITVHFAGKPLNNCYIDSGIQKGKSYYENWKESPTEIFESLQMKVIYPEVNWY